MDASGETLLQVLVGAAALIIILLIILIILCIPGVQSRMQQRSQCKDGDQNCNYSQCKELTKKDLRHVIIFFSTIIIFICVGLLTGDQSAMDYFSFASTITSIVLSVVAIIMTISSESKSESVKYQIDKSVTQLESAKATIQNYISQMKAQSEEQNKIFNDILSKSNDNLSKSEEILKLTKSLDQSIGNLQVNRQDITVDGSKPYIIGEDEHL